MFESLFSVFSTRRDLEMSMGCQPSLGLFQGRLATVNMRMCAVVVSSPGVPYSEVRNGFPVSEMCSLSRAKISVFLAVDMAGVRTC